MSGIMDKVKNALHSDKPAEQPEGTHGPHSSRAANTADPRVDSDRDHRARHEVGSTGAYSGTGEYSSGTGAYSENRAFNTTDGPATKTDGPHKSNIMNKADPRVDSDRDYSRNMGANPHGTSGAGAHNVGEGTQFSSGLATHEPHREGLRSEGFRGENMGSNVPEGTYGHHSTRAANAADPRIDSDLDNSRQLGGHSTGAYGTTGHHGTHTTPGENLGSTGYGTSGTHTHGEHLGRENLGTTGNTYGSSAARDTSGLGNQAYGTHSTGPAPSTAGPHKSDMMNKMDPRVDSNLDGSKTMGGDKTFSRSNEPSSAYAHKDPRDAAQVPPSVMQKHIGAPVVSHDGHEHDHTRRHSVSHQEQHRGL